MPLYMDFQEGVPGIKKKKWRKQTCRMCDLADPGQVLISKVVKSLCMGRNFQFSDLGDQNLKGFVQPIKVFVALR